VWGTGGDLGFTRDGTHAEALLVPVAALRRKPKNLTFAEAAAVGTPFLTAHLGLTQASLRDGEAVLVVGAAGAVGSAAVQIARWRGASVVAVVRDERQAEAARAFGATQVLVERPGEDAVVTLAGALGADAIDLAFDTSGVSLDACVHVLHRGGRTVVITAPPDGKTTFDLRELYRREAKILGVDSLQVSSTDAAAILDELAAGFASGRLRPPALTERPLADAVAAYETRGHKLVLIP
jgi:NADPH:quinone reductase-like Zn-dependent oxidoreductase